MIKEWGWDDKKVDLINKYYIDWQMNQKVELGDRINKILMGSYKNISKKNSTLDASESLITEKDTNLLGRKLFSAYRSAPNKVENIGALVDGKTNEKQLTFLFEKPKSKEEKGTWYLIRGRAPAHIDQVDPNFIIKKTEKEGLITELKEILDTMSRQSQLERNQNNKTNICVMYLIMDFGLKQTNKSQ
jgi:adenylate cyclase class 1